MIFFFFFQGTNEFNGHQMRSVSIYSGSWYLPLSGITMSGILLVSESKL